MENLKIQYAPYVPEVDFAEFVESKVGQIKVSDIIEGAKGNICIHPALSKADYKECVGKMAMEFVGKFLANKWNGWTWRWYVDEFMKRVGID